MESQFKDIIKQLEKKKLFNRVTSEEDQKKLFVILESSLNRALTQDEKKSIRNRVNVSINIKPNIKKTTFAGDLARGLHLPGTGYLIDSLFGALKKRKGLKKEPKSIKEESEQVESATKSIPTESTKTDNQNSLLNIQKDISEMMSTLDKLVQKVEYVVDRVAPKRISAKARKSERRKDIIFDPLAPSGAQFMSASGGAPTNNLGEFNQSAIMQAANMGRTSLGLLLGLNDIEESKKVEKNTEKQIKAAQKEPNIDSDVIRKEPQTNQTQIQKPNKELKEKPKFSFRESIRKESKKESMAGDLARGLRLPGTGYLLDVLFGKKSQRNTTKDNVKSDNKLNKKEIKTIVSETIREISKDKTKTESLNSTIEKNSEEPKTIQVSGETKQQENIKNAIVEAELELVKEKEKRFKDPSERMEDIVEFFGENKSQLQKIKESMEQNFEKVFELLKEVKKDQKKSSGGFISMLLLAASGLKLKIKDSISGLFRFFGKHIIPILARLAPIVAQIATRILGPAVTAAASALSAAAGAASTAIAAAAPVVAPIAGVATITGLGAYGAYKMTESLKQKNEALQEQADSALLDRNDMPEYERLTKQIRLNQATIENPTGDFGVAMGQALGKKEPPVAEDENTARIEAQKRRELKTKEISEKKILYDKYSEFMQSSEIDELYEKNNKNIQETEKQILQSTTFEADDNFTSVERTIGDIIRERESPTSSADSNNLGGQERTVTITNQAGETIEERIGGNINWRNNNPANIRPGSFANEHGAIGDASGYAVFPTREQGMAAADSLLKSKNYKDLNIAEAIQRWAPKEDNNDPVSYARSISNITGLDVSQRYVDLSPEEQSKVLDAMNRIEGGKVGIVRSLISEDQPQVAQINPTNDSVMMPTPISPLNGSQLDSGSRELQLAASNQITTPIIINRNEQSRTNRTNRSMNAPSTQLPAATTRNTENAFNRAMAKDYSHPTAFTTIGTV